MTNQDYIKSILSIQNLVNSGYKIIYNKDYIEVISKDDARRYFSMGDFKKWVLNQQG